MLIMLYWPASTNSYYGTYDGITLFPVCIQNYKCVNIFMYLYLIYISPIYTLMFIISLSILAYMRVTLIPLLVKLSAASKY